MKHVISLLIVLLWCHAALPIAFSAEIPPAVERIFAAHCLDCHDDATKEGGFSLASLKPDFSQPAWVRVHDKVSRGQMPPAGEDRPGPAENGASLLDTTQVLFTSNLGDASAHSSSNLPVLLAGGGFKHQGHVTYGTGVGKPLCNLYVRMLQQFGIEADHFGSSDGVVGEV